MKKFLGIGFLFSGIDKGLNKLFDKVNNSLKDVEDNAEELSGVKSKKGSFWDGLAEISKIGLLKNIADGVEGTSDKAQELASLLGGKGLGDSFKSLDEFAASYANRLKGAEFTSSGIQKLARDISKSGRITLESAGELLQTFDRQGISLKNNQGALKFLAKIQKISNVDAGDLGQTYATLTKNLGLGKAAAQGLFEQVTLMEQKSGKKGLVADLPGIIQDLRKAAESGLIPKGQIGTISKTMLAYRAGLENSGLSTEEAKSATDEYLDSVLKLRKSFVSAQFGETDVMELAKDFGFAQQNISDLNAAVKKGDVSSFLKGLTSATAGLPADRIQDFSALLESKFGPGVATTFANFRKKGFGEMMKLSKDITNMDAATRSKEFGNVYNNLINSVKEKEEELQSAVQRFDNLIDNDIQKANKSFLEAQIDFNNQLTQRLQKGTTTVFDDVIVGVKKFQKAGLTPFAGGIADTISSLKIFGKVTPESINKGIAAMNVFTPLINESAKEIFFFTGALSNIMKMTPGPGAIFGTLKSGMSSVGSAASGMASKAAGLMGAFSKMPGVMKAVNIAMRGVGVAFKVMTGPVGWIIAGLTALGAGLYQVYQRSETFRGIVDGVWESIKGLASATWDFVKSGLGPMFEGLKTGANFFLNWLNPIGLIINAVKGLGQIFPETFKMITAAFDPLIKIVDIIKEKVLGLFSGMGKWVKNSAVGKIFSEVVGSFGGGPKSVTQATSAKTQPNTVAVTNKMPARQTEAVLGAAGGTAGSSAFSARPTATAAAMQQNAAAQGTSESQKLAMMFSAVGEDIVQAISSGQQNITITLQGDARKLFRAQKNMTSNSMVAHGV